MVLNAQELATAAKLMGPGCTGTVVADSLTIETATSHYLGAEPDAATDCT